MPSEVDPGRQKQLTLWYWAGAVLIALTLIIGGVTRLTDSGLSMVEWDPILGVIPPLNEVEWEEAFEKYCQYPEYQQRNQEMSLAEFQTIFFWEYLHRLVGRLIGLVFLIPFGFFLWTRSFDRRQLRKAWLLLGLGASQGLMGWYMVQSGLAEQPWVSHYRLAAHLSLAVLIFLLCVWFALDLHAVRTGERKYEPGFEGNRSKWPGILSVWPRTDMKLKSLRLRRMLEFFFLLLLVQMIWGALVAGLNAGYLYNTFPLMNRQWLPSGMWQLEPWIQNLTSNPGTVQWVHRSIGLLIGLLATGLLGWVFRREEFRSERGPAVILFLMVWVQIGLGIATLVLHVPILLAVLHQAGVLILMGLLIAWIHRLRVMDPDSGWRPVRSLADGAEFGDSYQCRDGEQRSNNIDIGIQQSEMR